MASRKRIKKTALAGADEIGINQLLFCLSQIPDSRAANVTHSLTNILIMMLVAMAGGADHAVAIVEFCDGHATWFKRIFGINEIPSIHTFYRTACLLNPVRLEEAMKTWIQQWRNAIPGKEPEIVSIDGKAMNGYKESYLNIVSAFTSRNGLVLGGVCTEGSKRNEQAAMIKLVKLLSLEGAIVTSDAMGTQTTVVGAICEAGADYVLPVKDNQRDTAEAVKLCFDSPFTAIERYETVDKQGGRFEERVYELIVLNSQKPPFTEKWQNLAAVGKSVSTVTQKGETTVDVHYYIMSVTNMKDFASAARGHWGVESMHWILDVVFREDDCMLRDKNAQKNMGVLRKIILNAFKLDNPKSNIASRRRRSGWNEQELLKTIKLLVNI